MTASGRDSPGRGEQIQTQKEKYKESNSKMERKQKQLTAIFLTAILILSMVMNVFAVTGSTVAADGVYSTGLTAYKYKKGKLDKTYTGTLNVAVSDGKIAGLWVSNASSDKMSKLITNEIYYTYVGQNASVSAVQSVGDIDGVSSASVTGSTSSVNSSVKKQYVADIQSAIVTALGRASARSGSSSGTTTAAKTVQGTASVSDAEGSKLVLNVGLDSSGKIVSLTADNTSVSDWASVVSENAVDYIGKTADQIDAVSGATQYTAAVNTAVRAAMAKAGTSAAAPRIIAGNGASYTKKSGNSLTITSDADFSAFKGVKVDGTVISESNYSAESGSTVVTLNSSYLDTLSSGSHTVGIVSENGTATAPITVVAAPAGSGDDSDSDNTKSDAGKTIAPGGSATIYVGETLTLQGTKPSSYGNYHYWSTDEEDVDYIEWDIDNSASSSYHAGTNIAHITGLAAGKVTVTHQYVSGGAWVNPGEAFTITILEKSAGGSGTGGGTGSSGGSSSGGTYVGTAVQELTDGDYIIVDRYSSSSDYYALSNGTVGNSGSGYGFSGVAVDSFDGTTATVSDSAASVVWTYNSSNKSFYNAASGKYLNLPSDTYNSGNFFSGSPVALTFYTISGTEATVYVPSGNGGYYLNAAYPSGGKAFNASYARYISSSYLGSGNGVYFCKLDTSSSGGDDTITYEAGQNYTVENETFTGKKIVIESGATVIFSNVSFNNCTYDFSENALIEITGSFKESAAGTGSVTSYGVTLSGNGYSSEVGENFNMSLDMSQVIRTYTVSNVLAAVSTASNWATASVSGTTVTVSGTPTTAGTFPLVNITMNAGGNGFVVPVYIVVTDDSSNSGGSGTGGGSTGGDGDVDPGDPVHVKAITPAGSVESEYTITLNVTGQSKTTTTPGSTTSTNKVDVLFIADMSYSMYSTKSNISDGYGNMRTLDEALRYILSSSSGNSGIITDILNSSEIDAQVALVTFSESATTQTGWTNNPSIAYRAVWQMNAQYGNETNVSAGLTAGQTLLNSGRSDAAKVVILLSDGDANRPTDEATGMAQAIATARGMADSVTKFYAIGFNNATSNFMTQLATQFTNYSWTDAGNMSAVAAELNNMKGELSSLPVETDVPMSNVVITDTLSQYVELKTDETNSGVTLSASPADSSVSIDRVAVDGKEVKVTLDGELTDDTVYTVSIPVKPTEAAQTEANGNDDAVTGFVSNAGATLTYQYGTDAAKTVDYTETPKVYVAKQVTLAYDANAGEDDVADLPDAVIKAFENADAESVAFDISSTEPTREGYAFLGWATEADANDATYSTTAENLERAINIDEDTTLYAVWEENSFTVTWMNGEEVLETDKNVTKDTTPSFDGKNPTKDEEGRTAYEFAGWATNPDATEGKPVEALDHVTKNVTYYAVFNEITRYQIIIEDYTRNGATTTLVPDAYYKSGETVSFNVDASMATVLAIHTDGSAETRMDQNGTFERLYCTDSHEFSVTIDNADVYIIMAYKGDVNLDGDVDLIDAVMADRIYVKLSSLSTNLQRLVSDVDASGDLDLLDTNLIDRAYVKLYTMPWDLKE